MQPQEYTVNAYEKGTFQDNFGNTWCSMGLDGVSEPVRIALKDPMTVSVGTVLYGVIQDATSKTGKPYLKFKRLQRDDQQSFATGDSSTPSKPTYHDNSDGQRQGMCFNNAAEYVKQSAKDVLSPSKWADAVYAYAKALYLKGNLSSGSQGEDQNQTSDPPSTTNTSESPQTAATPSSGYDKAKAQAEEIRQRKQQEPESDMTMHEPIGFGGDEINLSDIPF